MRAVVTVCCAFVAVLILSAAVDRGRHRHPPPYVPPQPAPQPFVPPAPVAEKPMLVVVESTGCPACRALHASMQAPDARDEIVRFRLRECRDDREACHKYRVSAYPTLIVLDCDGRERGRSVGYLSPGALADWLRSF